MRRLRFWHRPAFWGFVFISPWIVGYLCFTLGPMMGSLLLSFCKYDLANLQFVGAANYERLFTNDPLFWKSLWNTATYTLFAVPLGLTGSLLLAVFLNQKVKGLALYRTLYYIPSLVPAVATALLWNYVFNANFGILNNSLRSVGMSNPPQWLQDPNWAMPAFVIMSLWGIGGGRMIIFLAGLQGIPDSYYEAADIDGAGALSKFRHITLPMLTPMIFFNMVLGIVGSFQVFTAAYIMTGGGPANATLFYVLYLFRQAFEEFRMGYASAMAWVLFIILLVFTGIQFWQAKKWVFYEGEVK
jgi:multiple sugar transport system permease protein